MQLLNILAKKGVGMMFRLIDSNGLKYYKIDAFERTGLVRHCFTTRMGGVSGGEYSSMNLRMNCDDDKNNVKKNFKIICDEIGVNFENLVFSNQVHGDIIYDVEQKDMGNGITKPNFLESADGLITSQRGIPLVTFYADCVPLFFLDPEKKVIALSHSGWRGTVKNIAAKTVEKMVRDYSSKPSDILAAIGPSIGECHFEVSDEVAEIFGNTEGGVAKKIDDKYYVNLQKTIENQLISSGIEEKNLTVANICTYCNSDLLFSHRKTNGKRGSLAAIMELI